MLSSFYRTKIENICLELYIFPLSVKKICIPVKKIGEFLSKLPSVIKIEFERSQNTKIVKNNTPSTQKDLKSIILEGCKKYIEDYIKYEMEKSSDDPNSIGVPGIDVFKCDVLIKCDKLYRLFTKFLSAWAGTFTIQDLDYNNQSLCTPYFNSVKRQVPRNFSFEDLGNKRDPLKIGDITPKTGNLHHVKSGSYESFNKKKKLSDNFAGAYTPQDYDLINPIRGNINVKGHHRLHMSNEGSKKSKRVFENHFGSPSKGQKPAVKIALYHPKKATFSQNLYQDLTSEDKDVPKVADKDEVTLAILERGLEYVYNYYKKEESQMSVNHTFDETQKKNCRFSIGKFSKFLCDFDCSLPNTKVIQVFNHATSRKGVKDMSLSEFKISMRKISDMSKKLQMNDLIKTKREVANKLQKTKEESLENGTLSNRSSSVQDRRSSLYIKMKVIEKQIETISNILDEDFYKRYLKEMEMHDLTAVKRKITERFKPFGCNDNIVISGEKLRDMLQNNITRGTPGTNKKNLAEFLKKSFNSKIKAKKFANIKHCCNSNEKKFSKLNFEPTDSESTSSSKKVQDSLFEKIKRNSKLLNLEGSLKDTSKSPILIAKSNAQPKKIQRRLINTIFSTQTNSSRNSMQNHPYNCMYEGQDTYQILKEYTPQFSKSKVVQLGTSEKDTTEMKQKYFQNSKKRHLKSNDGSAYMNESQRKSLYKLRNIHSVSFREDKNMTYSECRGTKGTANEMVDNRIFERASSQKQIRKPQKLPSLEHHKFVANMRKPTGQERRRRNQASYSCTPF
ncbi:unnamed protein product [Moneuplotes crassus]|uniref:Uncharacterized protein n=1 Tax=Euplotes crassus TaxID=5936 RepID=A0AAD1Y3A8_EUPCR|nr:unnamed protein product [Moneuplotes crassus]